MKTIAILILFHLPILVFSQKDQTFYFGVNGKIKNADEWVVKKEIDYKSKSKITVNTIKKEDTKEKVLFAERIRIIDPSTYEIKVKGDVFSNAVIRKFTELENGKFKFYDYQDGELKRSGFSTSKIPLIFEGEVSEFYSGGNKKSVSVYKNNEMISNNNWLENGEPYIDNVFYSVEKDPLFPRGMGYLHSHVLKTYTDSKLDLAQISGNIKVGFVVMENGKIDGIRIEKGINKTLDNLALQAFHTLFGEWTPAKIDGENVRCFQLFPINFIYTEYEYDYVEMRGSMLYWEIN